MTALLGVNRIHRILNLILFIALIGVSTLSFSENVFGQPAIHSDLTQQQLAKLFSKPVQFDNDSDLEAFDDLFDDEFLQSKQFYKGQQIVRDHKGNYFYNETLDHTHISSGGSNELSADIRFSTFYQVNDGLYLDQSIQMDGTPVIRRISSSGNDPIVIGVDIQLEADELSLEELSLRTEGQQRRRGASNGDTDGRSVSSDIGNGNRSERSSSSSSREYGDDDRDSSSSSSSSSQRRSSAGDDRFPDEMSAYDFYYGRAEGRWGDDDYYVIGDRAYRRGSGGGSDRDSSYERSSSRERSSDGDNEDLRGSDRSSERSVSRDRSSGNRDRDGQDNGYDRSVERERSVSRDRDGGDRSASRDRDSDRGSDRYSERERSVSRDRDGGDRSRGDGSYSERERSVSRDRSGSDNDRGRSGDGDLFDYYYENDVGSDRDSDRDSDRVASRDSGSDRYSERERSVSRDRDARDRGRNGDSFRERERSVSRDRDGGDRDRGSDRSTTERERSVSRDRDAGDRDRGSDRYSERERSISRDRDAGDRSRGDGSYSERERSVSRDRSGDRAQPSGDGDLFDYYYENESGSDRDSDRDSDRVASRDRGGDRYSERERSVSRDRDGSDRDSSRSREIDRERSASDRERSGSERSGSYSYAQENRDWVWEEHKFIYGSDFGSGTYAELAQDTDNLLYWMDDAADALGYDVLDPKRVHEAREINIGGRSYYITRVGEENWFGGGLGVDRRWVITRGLTIDGKQHHRLVSEFEHDLVVDYIEYRYNDAEEDSEDYKYWRKLSRKINSAKLGGFSYKDLNAIIDKGWIDYDLGYYPENVDWEASYKYYSYIDGSGSGDRGSRGSSRESYRESRRDGPSGSNGRSGDNFRERETYREGTGDLIGPSRSSETTYERDYERESSSEDDRNDGRDVEEALSVDDDEVESSGTVRRSVSSDLGMSGKGDGYSYYSTGNGRYAVYTWERDSSGKKINRKTHDWSAEQLQEFLNSNAFPAETPSSPSASDQPADLPSPDVVTEDDQEELDPEVAVRLMVEYLSKHPTSGETLEVLGKYVIVRADDGKEAHIPLEQFESFIETNGLDTVAAPETSPAADDSADKADLRSNDEEEQG